jgi:hypothetical protein
MGNIKQLLSIICIIFFTVFCSENNKLDYCSLIIGKWTRNIDLENEAQPVGYNEITYCFLGDSAIYYPGLYKLIYRTSEFSYRKHIGNKIKYEISNDTLKLFFPDYILDSDKHIIKSFKIVKITNDSLVLKSKHDIHIYTKVNLPDSLDNLKDPR